MKSEAVSCRALRGRYSELVDGRLPGSAAMRFWQHVRGCPDCGRYHRVVQRGVAVLRAVPGPAVSPGFHDRLRRRLAAERLKRSPRRSGLGGAVVLIAAMLAGTAWSGVIRSGGDVPAALVAGSTAPTGAASPPTVATAPPLPVDAAPAIGARWPSPTLDPSPSFAYSPLIVGPPVHRAADVRRRTLTVEPVVSD